MKHRFVLAAFGMVLAFAFIASPRADDAKPAAAPAAAPAATPANGVPPDLGQNGPASAPTGKEEPKPTQAQFDEGKRIFQNRCARCHGWNMVNLGSLSFDLRQFPHDDAVRFFHSVRYGKNAMPVWHDILSTEEIADVWAYVRTGGKM
ncbi:MAG TPA: cytochrome c [Stellaceae bacterium]|jgi:mono/diheme cytochrome c family protein|nr:cytochrome c [Stellaceae bacterium]